MNANEIIMMCTLIAIWISLFMALIVVFSATHFWLKQSKKNIKIKPLVRHPKITIVVPAHNEALVIRSTIEAILNLHYPSDKLEMLFYADNCEDDTYEQILSVVNQPQYASKNVTVIDRHGSGGKAGVLNEALAIAHGEYMCVYDADAMPEKYALHFLVEKALEDTERYVAVFGRNKTRNAKQNFLTKCINQEIVVTQRIQHVGLWHLFHIGRIPGTNFIIQTDYVSNLGGWENGALTEDTDISFKIMADNKLIALAVNAEAFQQEPETLATYLKQRKRWAKGNYQVVLKNFRHLFDRTPWRVKLETFYYTCTFFAFNVAIILSDIVFIFNVIAMMIEWINPNFPLPFTFGENNIYLSQILLFNWIIMILLYLIQVNIAMSTQMGQATAQQIWLALASYFTYAQLFIVISVDAIVSLLLDKLLHRDSTIWAKTQRFND